MLKLSVVPASYIDESPIGYTLRLAKSNGFRYINAMINKTIVNKIVKNQLSEFKFNDCKISHLYKENDSHIRNPLFKHNQAINPKVCLSCIFENKKISYYFQSPYSYLCTKHQCPLIDTCPHCKQSLSWELSLLDGNCTNPQCGFKLKQHSFIHPELTEKEDVSDCLLAGYLASNPATFFLTQTKWASHSSQLKLINDGYKLLNNKDVGQQWIKKLINNLPFYPKSFASIPFKILVKNINSADWPCIDIMKDALLKENSNKTNHECNLVTQAGVAMDLLGVDLFNLRQLNEKNLITIRNNERLTKKTLVDISNIIKKLRKLEYLPSMTPLSEQKSKMVFYDISPAKILISILNGELSAGYRPSTDLISSILIEPDELKNYAIKYFAKRLGNKVTLEQTKEMTGLPIKTLYNLKAKGILNTPSWYRPGCKHFCVFEDILKLRESLSDTQLSLNL